MAISNTAELFDSLFNTFLWLALLVGAVVFGLMGYLLVRYREKDPSAPDPEDTPRLGSVPRPRGKMKTVAVSLTLSTIVLSVLIIGTFGAIDRIYTPPRGTLNINVLGYQWAWEFTYPNGYHQVGELRVPVGEVVVLHITSKDVFHDFGVMEFRMKKDAIPGRDNILWFVADKPGVYTIRCYELCGLGHAFMLAKLTVMEPSDFQHWYSSLKVSS